MQAELIEIRNHLAQHAPFDDMPEETLDKIVAGIEVAYFRAGADILKFGERNGYLHYIRSGAVEMYRRTGELYNRLGEGEIFGQYGLLMSKTVRFPVKAIEDSLIYLIPDEIFQYLWKTTTTSPISWKLKTAPACALLCPGGGGPVSP